MIKKQYYQKRNDEFYTKFTKEEILNKIDINDPKSFDFFLKELDYPFIKEIWEIGLKYEKNYSFGKYIARMRLRAYKSFGYLDFNEMEEVEHDLDC